MTIRYVLSASIMAAALLAAAAGVSAAQSAQKIYLDPHTGDVIQHPARQAPSAESGQKAGTPSSKTKKNDGYTRWTTSDGTRMLAVDPSRTPHERVVHCADGSLRMGNSTGHDSQNAGNKADLCRKPMR